MVEWDWLSCGVPGGSPKFGIVCNGVENLIAVGTISSKSEV